MIGRAACRPWLPDRHSGGSTLEPQRLVFEGRFTVSGSAGLGTTFPLTGIPEFRFFRRTDGHEITLLPTTR